MPPVAQSVFAETLKYSEHFTAGSHEWLPYSDFPTFPKQSAKHQFAARMRSSVFYPGGIPQLSTVHSTSAVG